MKKTLAVLCLCWLMPTRAPALAHDGAPQRRCA